MQRAAGCLDDILRTNTREGEQVLSDPQLPAGGAQALQQLKEEAQVDVPGLPVHSMLIKCSDPQKAFPEDKLLSQWGTSCTPSTEPHEGAYRGARVVYRRIPLQQRHAWTEGKRMKQTNKQNYTLQIGNTRKQG